MVSLSTNYLGITEKLSTGIKYEDQFAVDWLDHNVLIFRDRAIHMLSLLRRGYSRQIYNGSKEVRNIVVSAKGFFFAWIDNDNNILRTTKDGLKMSRVHTEKSKIFCMTLDEKTKRFFYYIGGQGFTLQRSLDSNSYIHDRVATNGTNDSEETTKKRNRDKSQSTTTTPKPDEYFFVLYSKDFDGRYPPEREGSVRVKGQKSVPVQVTKYRGAVFVILQEEHKDNNGDFIYRLGQVMRTGEFKEIVENPNWRITSVMASTETMGSVDFCGRELNRCAYLCVHMSEQRAMCLCRDGAPGCTDTWMTLAPGEKGRTPPLSAQRESYVVTALIAVLLPVVCLLAYCLYTNYLAEEDEGDGSASSSSGTGSAIQSTMGVEGADAANLKQDAPKGGLWGALVNWAGLGSADSSSVIEGGAEELTNQSTMEEETTTESDKRKKSKNTSSVVVVSTESSAVEPEPLKKRKKRHKHRSKKIK